MKRDKYDILYSKIIRGLAGNRCEYCGTTDGQIECAHIVGRRSKSTRWFLGDKDTAPNAVSLCHHHHRHFTENPLDFTAWLNEYIGEDKITALRVKGWQAKKWGKEEKEEMYQTMKEMLQLLP